MIRCWHIDIRVVQGGPDDGLAIYELTLSPSLHVPVTVPLRADEFRELCEVGLALLDKDEAA